MKLKDKFDNPIMRHDLGRNEIEETKEQCVEIANEFAIDFAEWCDENYFRIGTTSFWAESLWDEKAITYKTEELLKIYESNNRI